MRIIDHMQLLDPVAHAKNEHGFLNELRDAIRLRNRVNKEYSEAYFVTHVHHFTLLHSKAQQHG